jgi:hypothetical protein
LFDVRAVSGSVWVSDDLAAVAMWDPPERSEAAARCSERVWAGYRAFAGEAAFDRLQRYTERLGLPCCLETSTTANRRFYERRGFTQATGVVLPGGPATWWLRRDSGHRST